MYFEIYKKNAGKPRRNRFFLVYYIQIIVGRKEKRDGIVDI